MDDLRGPGAEALAALQQVVSALRTLTRGKLSARLPGPTPTRADAGRMLARHLVIATQGIEDAAAPTIPVWRALPAVGDLTVGDQVNVLSHDLELALRGAAAEVWTPDGRAPLGDVLRDVLATAREVLRLL